MDKEKQEKNKFTSFVQGSIILVLSNVCIKAINFFLLPLYTKKLTPSMLGVSDSITTLTGFLLPLLNMGMDSAYSAFYFDEKDKNRDKRVYSTLGFVFFVVGIVPIALMPWCRCISGMIFHSEAYWSEIIVAFFAVTLNLWYLPFSLELRLKNRMKVFSIISIIASLSIVLLNILFVSVIGMKEMSLILSAALVAAEELVIMILFVGYLPQKNFFSLELLKKMFVFAIPMIPSVIMMWVLSLSDRYVLLYYQGEYVVGIYGIGLRFANILNVVIGAFSTAYTTFAFGSKGEENAKKQYFDIFNVVSLTLLIASFTISLFSKEIIMIMAENSYISSYKILRDLMFAQSLYAMTSIVSYGIFFEKKSIYSLIAVSLGAGVNLVLNFVFIPSYGMQAAALTSFIGYLVSFVVSYYYSEKLYPCDYGIKKIGITFISFYSICFFSFEMSFFVKILIWFVCIILAALAYRDIVTKMLSFFIHMIGGYFCRRKGR